MSFFFNDTATTEIYTLSLHDALPICRGASQRHPAGLAPGRPAPVARGAGRWARPFFGSLPTASVAQRPKNGLGVDRKSTRLNSSHANISYAVFCLKKKSNPLTVPLVH